MATVRANDRLAFEAPLARARQRSHAWAGPEGRGPGCGRPAIATESSRRCSSSSFPSLIGPSCRSAGLRPRALGRARLNDGQLLALTRAVAATGALSLPQLLPAFEHSHDPGVGLALVAALGRSPGLRSLTPEALERTAARLSRSGSAPGRAT